MSEYRHIVRKWVKPEDLNQNDGLFGGRLLQWVDEESAIIAVAQLGTRNVATRHMSAIDFVSRSVRGDLLELDYRVVAFGRTSITMSCRVENAITGSEVLRLDQIVFVAIDEHGNPVAHGRTEATPGTERLRE